MVDFSSYPAALWLFSGVAWVTKGRGQWTDSHPIDRIFARQMFIALKSLVEQEHG